MVLLNSTDAFIFSQIILSISENALEEGLQERNRAESIPSSPRRLKRVVLKHSAFEIVSASILFLFWHFE